MSYVVEFLTLSTPENIGGTPAWYLTVSEQYLNTHLEKATPSLGKTEWPTFKDYIYELYGATILVPKTGNLERWEFESEEHFTMFLLKIA
jgi:hypothetical protein